MGDGVVARTCRGDYTCIWLNMEEETATVCVSQAYVPRKLHAGFSAEILLLEGAAPGLGMSERKNRSRERNPHIITSSKRL